MSPEELAEGRALASLASEAPWWLDTDDMIRSDEASRPAVAQPKGLPADWQLIIWLRNNADALLASVDRVQELTRDNEWLRKLVLNMAWEHDSHTGALPYPESNRSPELAALLRSILETDEDALAALNPAGSDA